MRLITRDERGFHLDDYLAYLRENVDRLPNGARAFALANWHYDIKHHQCPHDSWLETIEVKENATGERGRDSKTDIDARFFGAYHDGYFRLIYRDVSSYSLGAKEPRRSKGRAHGDWILDEITMTDTGMVRHEIDFENAVFIVTCVDMEYHWIPQISRLSH